MIEDESGRIRLVGDALKGKNLVTGVIISALGAETPEGDFEVVDICFPGMAPQAYAEDNMKEDSTDEDAIHVDGAVCMLLLSCLVMLIQKFAHRNGDL